MNEQHQTQIKLLLILILVIIITLIYETSQGQYSNFSRYEKQDVMFYGVLSSLIAYIIYKITYLEIKD